MNDLDHLLEKTSRTFALSIPLLPEPTRGEVTVAYLLFRIADTFEDAAVWSKQRRIEALERFARVVAAPRAQAERLALDLAEGWADALPSDHQGYLDLLAAIPFVLDSLGGLAPEAQEILVRHTVRTSRGMARFVERADEAGRLELADEPDLADYCYVVAGIVGEMLTELFLLRRAALAPHADLLRRNAARFGEALQLVNILKDSASDAREGRRFLPPGLDRASVFARARADLVAAAEYVDCLQRSQSEPIGRGAERGLVAFTALPVRLAWATLDRVESSGAGSKLTRPEVYAIVADLENALDHGTPAVPVGDRVVSS